MIETNSKFLLVSVIDREILTEWFNSFEEAHDEMIEELCIYGQVSKDECTKTEYERDGCFGYYQWSAYANDGLRNRNYDWRIVELPM